VTAPLSDHALEIRVLATLADVSGLDVNEARAAAERSGLTDVDFHSPLHAAIWTAQMGLLFDGEACDFYRAATRVPAKLAEQVRKLNLAAQAPGVSMLIADAIRGAAQDLRSCTLRRHILAFGRDLAAQVEAVKDPAVLLANAQAALARITASRNSWRNLTMALAEADREMQDIAAGKGSPVIPSGMHEWDRIVGGLWPTLTVIGAHPGHGKSGLIARMLLNLAAAGKTVAIFSLEDHATWMAYRALSSVSGVTQFVLRNRKLNEQQAGDIQYAKQSLAAISSRILIDDRGRLPGKEVVASARDAILNHGAQAVVVDHWGEVVHEGSGDRHDLLIADDLSALRQVSKVYGVPIVVAAHLKPAATYPFTQHDFRNAAAFEQMARVLIAWELKDGVLRMQALKNTNGVKGNFELPFHGPSAMVLNSAPPPPGEQGALL